MRTRQTVATGATLGWMVIGLSGCSVFAATFLDLPRRETVKSVSTQTDTVVTAAAPTRVVPPIEDVDADSALKLLPRDAAGYVDWVAALRDGIIDPQASASQERDHRLLAGFGYDLTLEDETGMFNAAFPHSKHVELMVCETCHPALLPDASEGSGMAVINEGESCGRCHGTVAFPVDDCERCHTTIAMDPGRVTAGFLGTVTMARGGGDNGFPQARFPHFQHRIRYKCSACHPVLFDVRAGTDTVQMSDIMNERSCGTCHNGRVAFSSADCMACHVQGEPGRQSD